MLRQKTDKALRTIGEAAAALEVAVHVIRFWETNFSNLKPVKYNGRRYYSPENMHVLKQIKALVHEQNYSIKEAIAKFKKPVHPFIKIRERLIKAKDRLCRLLELV
jgi:DNA-binding transcriptional MerR regulator